MGELKMDTCWIKAHFFAQIAIESGKMLPISKGENMNYSRTRLEDIFPSRIFEGKMVKGRWVSDRDELGQRIYQKGKKIEIDAIYQKTDKADREKAISNFVYATTNGNNGGDDGWIDGESCDAFVGAVIVFNYSHVAFIIGQTEDGLSYVYLGGNQGGSGSGKRKITKNKVKKNSGTFWLTKPKNYSPSTQEKELPVLNVTDNTLSTYENTH